jgi:pimeloyl-ACP methyl ester carboxylesterase
MKSTSLLEPERPSLGLLGSEPLRAAFEFLSHQFQPAVASAHGDGHQVILFPGLATDGTALIPLRNHCRALGYDAVNWGRGFNTGPDGGVDAWLAELSEYVVQMIGNDPRPISMIGWSLGGIYARELAKRIAPRVRQVITIGTPFNGAADQTHAGWLYTLLNGKSSLPDQALISRLRTPPPVPTTSIYSRSDGIVAWQACVHDRPMRTVQDIEVIGSHMGMGWNHAVFAVVADRLQQDPAKWHPYADSARAVEGVGHHA